MRARYRLIVVLAAFSCLMAVACRGTENRATPAVQSKELPLPPIPAALTEPQARADYLAEHFWDTMDFADTRASLDSMFVEQAMANFGSVADIAAAEAVARGVARAMTAASEAGESVYALFFGIAELYFYEPASPQYNEAVFSYFADADLRLTGNERSRYVLEDISRNAPGSPAPDFYYEAFGGGRKKLLTGEPTLLFFYEPDCPKCESAIDELRRADPAIRVVMIYPGTEREHWLEHAAKLPPQWEAGISPEADESYQIRATPSFYVIDAEGRIAVKDSPRLPGL